MIDIMDDDYLVVQGTRSLLAMIFLAKHSDLSARRVHAHILSWHNDMRPQVLLWSIYIFASQLGK